MNMGLSGLLFRRGCLQLSTEQGLLGLENGEEETVFNFGMSPTASLPVVTASTHEELVVPSLKVGTRAWL